MALRPYIVGNWKMNGLRATLAEARAIDRVAARHPAVDVGIAPPFTLVHAMAEEAQAMAVGGQDVHAKPSGAYTGDISAPMLEDAGARFTIVGHSERRSLHGESNADVQAKALAARAAGLGVILCVGETEAERDAGQAEAVVSGQLHGSLPKESAEGLAVAYEPVWAIGTGRVPSVEDVAAMHRAIRADLVSIYGDAGKGVRILYGGSVNAGNASELLGVADVGGALVGGASLTAESFAAIINAAAMLIEG
ncbi:triose-phosphate isomerase [Novosphingobium sp. SG707]|uniref:triose-phosphate isomerase n=1 Tax=Novosphingobium sp. SG707 TaxID=2586996 RepID=UPI0014458AD6|nr:triose-phosphate isomerase [Novosphingobium sp. SG707]NKI99237.1 triosephosphate isomerase [Novosphingobium sp. SG707]